MPFGYHGKILHVDLTTHTLSVEYPPEDFYRFYMGGSSIGLYYLLKNTRPGVDPLSPENVLTFALSVVTGAPISGLSRMTATAKSPFTDCVGDSQCGGFFPAEMKFAGFDAVVIKGKSEAPVYLWIHDSQAELKPADHLWGLFTNEVEEKIKQELGDPKIEIAQCGPAAEKGIRFAGIINMCSRANGRTGMGAVMASKNLKAVAVRGKDRPALANRESLIKLAKSGADGIEDSGVYTLGLYGTSQNSMILNSTGGLVSHNWDSGHFENAEALDGRTMAKTILKERDSCYACTVRCKRVVEIHDGIYEVDPKFGGPEFETIAAFGSYCGIDDLKAIARASQLCNMYGMDTITCGATIAWAMDCYEKGIITAEDTGGIELHYGDVKVMLQLTEMIGKREGFGDVLAEGSARAARLIGRGSEDLVVAVKNQELPAHMPQTKRSLGLIYAVNPFGADHQSSEHDPVYETPNPYLAELGLTNPQPGNVLNHEKVRFAFVTQCAFSALDTLDICQFVFGPAWQLYSMSQLAQAVEYITGWQVSVEDLLLIGERRLNMLRAFNAREGIGREADKLPKKLYQALTGGKTNGVYIREEEICTAQDQYYEMAGWDVLTGTPTKEKLNALGLGWIT